VTIASNTADNDGALHGGYGGGGHGHGGGGYGSHGGSNTQQGGESMAKDQSFWTKYTFKE
jgi:hypothetical protein